MKNTLSAGLRQHARDFRVAMERAGEEFGEIELAEMKDLTPVRYGDLVASGHIEVFWRNMTLVIRFIFDMPYAVYVHEDLEAFHAIGQAKFVEQPLNESKPFVMPRIAASLKRQLGL